MKIIADDKKASLGILQNDPFDSCCGYTMRLHLETQDGVFSGENSCAAFQQ